MCDACAPKQSNRNALRPGRFSFCFLGPSNRPSSASNPALNPSFATPTPTHILTPTPCLPLPLPPPLPLPYPYAHRYPYPYRYSATPTPFVMQLLLLLRIHHAITTTHAATAAAALLLPLLYCCRAPGDFAPEEVRCIYLQQGGKACDGASQAAQLVSQVWPTPTYVACLQQQQRSQRSQLCLQRVFLSPLREKSLRASSQPH